MLTSKGLPQSPSGAGAGASCLKHTASSAAKEAKLPAAASIQTGPELSAREARRIPATNNAGLNPLIVTPTCFMEPILTTERLAPPSDNLPSRWARGRGTQACGGAA
jgi:hypothetical protein